MNAGPIDKFQSRSQHFDGHFSKPAQPVVRIFCKLRHGRLLMASSRTAARLARVACTAAATLATLSRAGAAWPRQGPGGGPGTASSSTQLAMAIIVWETQGWLSAPN
jgi:hypothetical protein